MKNTKVMSSPFLSILALVFITLKLAGIGVVATWSWWWVLSPLWLPIVLVLSIILIAALIAAMFSK